MTARPKARRSGPRRRGAEQGRGIVLVGTDTGAGKTTLGRALLRALHRRGVPVRPYKPVESGVGPRGPLDARALWRAAGRPGDLAEVCSHALPAPVAPWVAARAVGLRLDRQALVRRARALAAPRGSATGETATAMVVVETAGGLLAPFGPHWTGADLARDLDWPVVVVARHALGTVNHTALTVEAARRRGLRVVGVVLVETTGRASPDRASNAELIAAAGAGPVLGVLPYLARATDDGLADALERALDVTALLARAGWPRRAPRPQARAASNGVA